LVDGWSKSSPLVHMLSALIAGGACAVVTNPLWVVRTRMITQPPVNPRLYRTSFHAVVSILRNEGLAGFYKGLGPSFIGVFHVVVQFPLYERLKLWFQRENERPRVTEVFLASTISKLTASTVTYPHEVLRTRLQNQRGEQPPKYWGLKHATGLIWREEGIGGFYRGLPTNLIRVVPASAVMFLTYELVLDYLNYCRI